MAACRSLEDLRKKIQDKINDALTKEVTDYIALLEVTSANENVYGVYSPKEYERRYDEGGGLANPKNIVGSLITDGILKVDNNATFNQNPKSGNHGNELAKLIEYGDGGGGYYYDYARPGRSYMEPRPFIQKTKEWISENDDVKDIFEDALKRRGLKVK